MDGEILALIRQRDNLRSQFEKDPSPELKKEYSRFQNFTKNRISFKKRQYFKSQFENMESQSIWKTFSKLTGKSICQSNDVSHLKLDNVTVSDKAEVAKMLCSTFILEDETSDSDKIELSNTLQNDATVEEDQIIVSPRDISNCIHKLKLKSSGQDKVPIKMLKPLLPYLIVPLAIFFTTIFKTCNYPLKFKEALVLPLYKGKGTHVDPNNYRPIASLHSVSNLFEYILKFKLMTPIEELDKLDQNQHGFRSGRSCTTALTVISQNVFNGLDRPNFFVIVAYIDLRKGFYSLSHYHLLKMLRNVFKVNAKFLLLIAEYLKDRRYLVTLGKFISKLFIVNRGIGVGLRVRFRPFPLYFVPK